MRHADHIRTELESQYQNLTDRIHAIDTDLRRALDSEERMVLQDRRADLAAQRDRIDAELSRSDTVPISPASRNRPAVEYDELMKLIYETRTELALLKNQVAILMERTQTENSGLSPHLLTFLAVGGVLTLVLLVFLVSRYLLP